MVQLHFNSCSKTVFLQVSTNYTKWGLLLHKPHFVFPCPKILISPYKNFITIAFFICLNQQMVDARLKFCS